MESLTAAQATTKWQRYTLYKAECMRANVFPTGFQAWEIMGCPNGPVNHELADHMADVLPEGFGCASLPDGVYGSVYEVEGGGGSGGGGVGNITYTGGGGGGDPSDTSAMRKATPVFSGCLRYFPKALAAVARLSKAGNDKHNPGEPLHWSRGKSNDHGDCLVRHQMDFDEVDPETGEYHAVAVAWRALAQLELLEEKRVQANHRSD